MSQIWTGLAAVVLAIGVGVLSTPAASAHDTLDHSSPAHNDQLHVSPDHITLTFSGPLRVIDGEINGTLVYVVDESGTDWASAPPVIEGDTITVALSDDMPDAGYQVRWQTLSGDGFPIAGAIPFTVGDAEPFRSASVPVSPDASTVPGAESVAAGPALAHPATRGIVVGTVGAFVALSVFIVLRLRRTRHRV